MPRERAPPVPASRTPCRICALAASPVEDSTLLDACDRLHRLLDRQRRELHGGGTAAARRCRNLRREADDLEAEIAAMPIRSIVGRRAVAEVALRLVPLMPGLMVLARASLLDLSRLGLDDETSGSDAELLVPLLHAAELQARRGTATAAPEAGPPPRAPIRRSTVFGDAIAALLERAAALPASTMHRRRAKARALIAALGSGAAAGLRAALAVSLARDVLGALETGA